eukprot:6666213-Prymnesium_polylepis.1
MEKSFVGRNVSCSFMLAAAERAVQWRSGRSRRSRASRRADKRSGRAVAPVVQGAVQAVGQTMDEATGGQVGTH